MDKLHIQQFEVFSAERAEIIKMAKENIRRFMEGVPPERVVDALESQGWRFDITSGGRVSGVRVLYRYIKKGPDGTMNFNVIFDDEDIDATINLSTDSFWGRDFPVIGVNIQGLYRVLANPETFYEKMTNILVEEIVRLLSTAKNQIKSLTKEEFEKEMFISLKPVNDNRYEEIPRIFRQLFGDTPENIGHEIFNDPRERLFSEYYGIPKGSSKEEIVRKLRSREIRKSMF